MLANRADLDVYGWAKVGKGLAKLKTAQNIAIISHLEKYVHTVYLLKHVLENEVFFRICPFTKKVYQTP